MRVGTVTYATEQGLGYLSKWFFDAGVITDALLVRHPRHPHQDGWYPAGTPFVNPKALSGPAVDEFLGRIDVLLQFETPFDWSVLARCKEREVRTVLVPMHEWTPRNPPGWFDRVVSPSLLDQQYFLGSPFVPIPVAPDVPWERRTVVRRWLHNAGHVGHREHKGTRQLLEAVKLVKAKDFHLTVRCQYHHTLLKMADGCGLGPGRDFGTCAREYLGGRVRLTEGSMPRALLHAGFDAYVAPEKFNGLSVPLQEARAAGMLVVTTDRFPHNSWLPTSVEAYRDDDPLSFVPMLHNPLIPVAKYDKACINSNYLEFDEAVVEPAAIAAKIDEWHGRDVTDYSLSGRAWAEEHSWEKLKPRWLEVLS